jgi:peptidoglycan/LPS O-acetylase OafA/YrhL
VKRLIWLDVSKGLAILWVVYFHFFMTYTSAPLPIFKGFISMVAGPDGWEGFGAIIVTLGKIAGIGVSQLGFHAVGAFLVLSGWAVFQATERRAIKGPIEWRKWYWSRFIRLYPMYWVAHLVYLVSPFVAHLEPVDGRIILSLLGLRFIDISMNFMYLNAAWWYLSMLIQFYVAFPILYYGLRKLGGWPFLALACLAGFFARYMMLVVIPQNGSWVLGGFALCRLPEFALGMVLGGWHRRNQARAERFLLGGPGLAAGVLLYPLALTLYANPHTYVFVDFATGACCLLVIVGIAGLICRADQVSRLIALVGVFSYGLYLIHQPYVIWVGVRIKEQPVWVFLLLAVTLMIILSAWGMLLEKSTNVLIDRLTSRKRTSSASS